MPPSAARVGSRSLMVSVKLLPMCIDACTPLGPPPPGVPPPGSPVLNRAEATGLGKAQWPTATALISVVPGDSVIGAAYGTPLVAGSEPSTVYHTLESGSALRLITSPAAAVPAGGENVGAPSSWPAPRSRPT